MELGEQEERPPVLVARQERVWGELERAFGGTEGEVGAALLAVDVHQEVVSRGIVGCQRDRTSCHLLRLRPMTLLVERSSEPDEGGPRLRVTHQHIPERPLGLGVAPEVEQRLRSCDRLPVPVHVAHPDKLGG